MTTIAAFMDDKGRVAIAADRAWSNDRVTYHTKLFKVGHMAVGISALDVMASVIADLAKMDEPPATPRELAKAAYAAYKESGQERSGEHDKQYNAHMIIIEPGERPWSAPGSGGVMQYGDAYASTGTGENIALGTLFTARRNNWTATRAARFAVEAAVHHDPWSGGKVDIIVFEPVEERVDG